MARDRKTEIEYQVLKLMMEGTTNSRKIIDSLVAQGWGQDEVLAMLVYVAEQGYATLHPLPPPPTITD